MFTIAYRSNLSKINIAIRMLQTFNDLYIIYQNEIMKGIFSFFELRINNTFFVRLESS